MSVCCSGDAARLERALTEPDAGEPAAPDREGGLGAAGSRRSGLVVSGVEEGQEALAPIRLDVDHEPGKCDGGEPSCARGRRPRHRTRPSALRRPRGHRDRRPEVALQGDEHAADDDHGPADRAIASRRCARARARGREQRRRRAAPRPSRTRTAAREPAELSQRWAPLRDTPAAARGQRPASDTTSTSGRKRRKAPVVEASETAKATRPSSAYTACRSRK